MSVSLEAERADQPLTNTGHDVDLVHGPGERPNEAHDETHHSENDRACRVLRDGIQSLDESEKMTGHQENTEEELA